jgi:predicted nucleic acid-binding Zn finger protein
MSETCSTYGKAENCMHSFNLKRPLERTNVRKVNVMKTDLKDI